MRKEMCGVVYPCMWTSRDGPPTRDPPDAHSGSRASQRKKSPIRSMIRQFVLEAPAQYDENSDGCVVRVTFRASREKTGNSRHDSRDVSALLFNQAKTRHSAVLAAHVAGSLGTLT